MFTFNERIATLTLAPISLHVTKTKSV